LMLREETRRVQFTGRSSFILNLPKAWVIQNGISQGDVMSIATLPDGSLVVTPREATKANEKAEALVRVAPDAAADALVRRLVSLYIAGYASIRVVTEGGATLLQREMVKDLIRTRFVGTEIVSESAEGMTLQVLLSLPELSVKNAIRRMAVITTYMIRDAFQAAETLDGQLANSVIKADNEVDRFSLYVIRHLVSAVSSYSVLRELGLGSPAHCLGYRVVVKSVERIADHAVRMAETSLTLRGRFDGELLSELRSLRDLAVKAFEDSMAALFKEDYDQADRIFETVEKCRAVEAMILTRASEGDRADLASLRLMVEDLRRCAEYASDIAEVVLNMTVKGVQR
jgi:phosphate uptake regulator